MNLVESMTSAWQRGERVFLATVVSVEGSAYRHEGAKLLVFEDGSYQGMISGGCLEPEIGATVSRFDVGEPIYRHFDLRDDSVFGLGMGCGGMVGVFIEPALDGPVWRSWLQTFERNSPSVRALVYQSDVADVAVGAFLVIEENCHRGSTGDEGLDREVLARSRALLESDGGASRELDLEGLRLLLDVSLAPPRLVIFGGGDDAIPVARLAHMTGFGVTVVDARASFVTSERFPESRLIIVPPEQYSEVGLRPKDLIIIMHHHLAKDAVALGQALQNRCKYIGLLGPPHRFEKVKELLEQDAHPFGAFDFSRIDTPIGVDIGARGPEEIALSIMAKLVSVRRGSSRLDQV